jgi:hypothetical protein
LLNIPGVTPTTDGNPQRIGAIMSEQTSGGWVIPLGLDPDVLKKVVLWLGLSPYVAGKNFDMMWSLNQGGEDDNGLPFNPEWSAQVSTDPFSNLTRPDFDPSCVSNGNLNLGMASCTSQETSEDLNSGFWSSFIEFTGYCSPGPPHGHVNWSIATYSGQILWRAWSGHWPNDNDDNFGLETPLGWGQTLLSENDNGQESPGIGVEFNQEETLDNFGTKFWQDFDAASDKVKVNMIDNSGMTIITGLVGVDGVHGGYSELHPVYAMAVETATPERIRPKTIRGYSLSGTRGMKAAARAMFMTGPAATGRIRSSCRGRRARRRLRRRWSRRRCTRRTRRRSFWGRNRTISLRF